MLGGHSEREVRKRGEVSSVLGSSVTSKLGQGRRKRGKSFPRMDRARNSLVLLREWGKGGWTAWEEHYRKSWIWGHPSYKVNFWAATNDFFL